MQHCWCLCRTWVPRGEERSRPSATGRCVAELLHTTYWRYTVALMGEYRYSTAGNVRSCQLLVSMRCAVHSGLERHREEPKSNRDSEVGKWRISQLVGLEEFVHLDAAADRTSNLYQIWCLACPNWPVLGATERASAQLPSALGGSASLKLSPAAKASVV
jgi:hypothetical protein